MNCGRHSNADKDEIFIRPNTGKPREGWGEALVAMHRNGDDSLLIDEVIDLDELEWK